MPGELHAELGRLQQRCQELEADKARLDWIESKTDGNLWVARGSLTGRGFRLHNSGDCWVTARKTAREAIDAAMNQESVING